MIQTCFVFRAPGNSKSPEAEAHATTGAREAHAVLIAAQAQAEENAHVAVAAVQA